MKLKNELKKENEENSSLKKKLEELEKEKNILNRENSNLKKKLEELEKEKNNQNIFNNNKIMELNDKLKNKDEEIKNLKQKVIELNSSDNNRNKELQKLYWELEEKGKEIENLNNQLIGSIKYDDLKKEDKLIAVNFISGDQKINFPIICKASSLFAEVELTFYKKYPEFGLNCGNDNLFISKGNTIERIRTMAQNGFPGYTINVMKNEKINKYNRINY